MRSVIALGLVGLTLVAFGCGDDGGTTPTPISYDGTWSGTTSQGLPFTLVVSNNAVTRLNSQINAQGSGGTCGVNTSTGTDISPAAAISSGSFSLQVHYVTTQNHDVSFTWAGTFASASSASGTVTFTVILPACGGGRVNVPVTGSATWTASK